MKNFAPKSHASVSLALISALAASMSLAACGSDSGGFKSEETTGGTSNSGGDNQGGEANTGGSGASGGSDASGGSGASGGNDGSGGGSGGDVTEPECSEADPCQNEEGICVQSYCVEGACIDANITEGSPCAGGTCNAFGQCIQDTCSTGVKDGAETDVDCGGPCEPCADTLSCSAGSDCVSGVCTNAKCAESDCDDGIKNGAETDVDCGGTCSQKCALGDACQVSTDCAVAAGDLAESVRCVESACVSTKPPAGFRYWQDFSSSRRVKDTTDACDAHDDYCVNGVVQAYQMHGKNAAGEDRAVTTSFFVTGGVIGRAGQFDGNFCLARGGTNLSMPDQAAVTVMAWVKDEKTASPWQSSLVNANRFGVALDSNSSAERFLASLKTDQKTLGYQNATSTGQVPGGEWHHVAFVYSNAGGEMLQYVDGVEINSVAITGNLTSGNQLFLMGCATLTTQFFKGLLDEVVLYPKALTPSELAEYVKNTKP